MKIENGELENYSAKLKQNLAELGCEHVNAVCINF